MAGEGLGLLTLAGGAWLLYAAVSNQAPIKTLEAIVANPGSVATILKQKSTPIQAGGSTSGGSTSGGSGASIVAFARQQIGQPYKFGGHGSGSWDCSGLTMESLKTIGVSVPHSATAQLLDPRGKHVTKDQLQLGDLVFPDLPPLAGDHVQIYSGNGNIIEAAKPGTKVREVPMWGFYAARRYWTAGSSGGGVGGGGQ